MKEFGDYRSAIMDKTQWLDLAHRISPSMDPDLKTYLKDNINKNIGHTNFTLHIADDYDFTRIHPQVFIQWVFPIFSNLSSYFEKEFDAMQGLPDDIKEGIWHFYLCMGTLFEPLAQDYHKAIRAFRNQDAPPLFKGLRTTLYIMQPLPSGIPWRVLSTFDELRLLVFNILSSCYQFRGCNHTLSPSHLPRYIMRLLPRVLNNSKADMAFLEPYGWRDLRKMSLSLMPPDQIADYVRALASQDRNGKDARALTACFIDYYIQKVLE